MKNNKCFYCMEDMKTFEGICPHCGRRKQPEYALRPGTILKGRYLVGVVLDQSRFELTYIGFDLLQNHKIVIKEYYLFEMADRDYRNGTVLWNRSVEESNQCCEFFLRKAARTIRLDPIPNLVHARHLFLENNTAYIVMDYVEGQTLLEKLSQCGCMSFDQAVELFMPIINALAEAHKHKLMHGFIDPENILIRADGSACLMNLDVNTFWEWGNSEFYYYPDLSREPFLPTELYSKGGKIGPWTDTYEICAVIYVCCTGKVLPGVIDRALKYYTEGTDREIARASLTAKENAFLKKGLALKIKERFQNMDELSAAMQECRRRKIHL